MLYEVCYNFGTALYVVHFTKFIREHSGSEVESLTLDRGAAGLACVIEQETLILA